MTATREPTERDQFWLEHDAKLLASGLTAKAYAAANDLSLHSFYQSRKRLRALGLIETSRSVRSDKKKCSPKSVAFSKIELTSPPRSGLDFRLSLPNGLVLEWSGGELPTPVIDLVERLTQSR